MLTVNKLREATQIPLKHEPVKAVEVLADKFQLTESERGDILRQLFMQGDSSRYGLVNAVTAASKIAKSYERATDLERIGGEILSLPLPRNILYVLARINSVACSCQLFVQLLSLSTVKFLPLLSLNLSPALAKRNA